MSEIKLWLLDAGIRAIKTVAQAAMGCISGAVVFSDVDWLMVLSASLLAGVASILMSLTSIPALKKKE